MLQELSRRRFLELSSGLLVPAQFGVPANLGISVNAPPAFTTYNPSDKGADVVLSSGNLHMANAVGSWESARSVASKSSGKFYWETTATPANDLVTCGICDGSMSVSNYCGVDTHSYGYVSAANQIFHNGANVQTMPAWNSGHVLCIALDIDNNAVWFRVDGGNWNNNVLNDPATNTGGIAISGMSTPYFAAGSLNATDGLTANFGASAFGFTVPSGFTSGLPA